MDKLYNILQELDDLEILNEGTPLKESRRLVAVESLLYKSPWIYYADVISDLLYYDGILCPEIWRRPMKVSFRTLSANVLRKNVNDFKEVISIQNKLMKAGLLVDGKAVIGKNELEQWLQEVEKKRDEINQVKVQNIQLGQQWRDIAMSCQGNDELRRKRIEDLLVKYEQIPNQEALDKTAGEFNTKKMRLLASSAEKHGYHVTPRYTSSCFSESLAIGADRLTGIIYHSLPTIDVHKVSVNAALDFINDPKTKELKRRLFSWQNNIENRIEKGDIKIEHIPDLIATRLDEYKCWIEKSKLKLKYEKRELVYYFITSLLTAVKLPEAIQKYFEFKKRKLDLMDDEKAPGRELAYIIHTGDAFL